MSNTIEDHAIARMLAGLSISNVERAAYECWSDRVDGRQLSDADEFRELGIIADITTSVVETPEAARKYAHARAHNMVRG
jgi:hypothetical protein